VLLDVFVDHAAIASPSRKSSNNFNLFASFPRFRQNPGGLGVCSNGFPGVQSFDGLACCPAECGSCDTCGTRRLTFEDSDSDECFGKRRNLVVDKVDRSLTGGSDSFDFPTASSDSFDAVPEVPDLCGVLRKRRRLTLGSVDSFDLGSGSSDSIDGGFEDFCDCGIPDLGSSASLDASASVDSLDVGGSTDSVDGLLGGFTRRRDLTFLESSDSGDGCDCGFGRRLTFGSFDKDSSDDCGCFCECECTCPPVDPVPDLSCCADAILGDGNLCSVVGAAPCVIGGSWTK